MTYVGRRSAARRSGRRRHHRYCRRHHGDPGLGPAAAEGAAAPAAPRRAPSVAARSPEAAAFASGARGPGRALRRSAAGTCGRWAPRPSQRGAAQRRARTFALGCATPLRDGGLAERCGRLCGSAACLADVSASPAFSLCFLGNLHFRGQEKTAIVTFSPSIGKLDFRGGRRKSC